MMTETKPGKPINLIPGPYTLELSFDAAQITQSLRYAFYKNYDAKNPKDRILCEVENQGSLAGTYNFPQNAEINIVIIAGVEGKEGGKTAPPLELNITNCTIVSIEPPVAQGLSLFDAHNACTSISEWSLPEEITDMEQAKLMRKVRVRSLNPLIVTADTGQWKISGYLSALYNTGKGPVARLFYFDPEGSAGAGAGAGD